MSEPTKHEGPLEGDATQALREGTSAASLAAQFEEDWRRALRGAPPPDLESFLKRLDAAYRNTARRALEEVEHRFRRQWAGLNQSPETYPSAKDGTLAWSGSPDARFSPSADDDGTTLLVGSAGTTPASEDVTLEYRGAVTDAPEEGFDPEATEVGAPRRNQAERPTKLPVETEAAAGSKRRSPRLPRVPGYDILGELGRGGMSVVYWARDQRLKRLVALKMIQGGDQASADALARFRNEAEAVAEFQHPHIVQIYEVGEVNGAPYCALEFVDGPSLEQLWKHEPMAPARAAALTETLARTIHDAHRKKIVHRDLKPSNVLLTQEGTPKICDFGIVKRIETDDSALTQSGVIMGTPSYMAPEQAWGAADIGPAVDIYALGALLYALVTGRAPFAGANAVDTVLQVRSQEPVPPSRLQPKIPRDLETICLKCLHKDPTRRYATAEDLAEDLRRFQAGEPILARPVSRAERIWRWARRNRALAASLGAAAGLLLLLTVGGWLSAAVITQKNKDLTEAYQLANSQKTLALAAQKKAEEKEQQANAAKQLAVENEKQAVAAKALAVENEKKATAAKGEAEENAKIAQEQSFLAMKAYDAIVYGVQDQLTGPNLQPLRRALLTTALNGIGEIVGDAKQSRKKNVFLAGAHRRMGDIYLELGQNESALEQYAQCRAIIEPLFEQNKLGNAHHNLSFIYLLLGDASMKLDRLEDARRYYARALEIRQTWQGVASDNFMVGQNVAAAYGKLGELALKAGDPKSAAEWFRQALDLRRQWVERDPNSAAAKKELAGAQQSLTNALFQLPDQEVDLNNFLRDVESLEQLSHDQPTDITLSANVGIFHNRIGEVYLVTGDPHAAKRHYATAVERLKNAHERDPVIAAYRRALGQAYYGLGTAQRELNEPEALEQFQNALQVRKELVQESPENPSLQIPLMLALARCGDHAEAAKLARELLAQAPEDPYRLFQVACGFALCADAAAQGKDPAALSPDERRMRQDYRTSAIDALRGAIERGFSNLSNVSRDPDLAPLRGLDDYRRLIEQLEAKLKNGSTDKALAAPPSH